MIYKSIEYTNEIILVAPIIKIKRFEWLIQKATELGVSRIIPMNSKYVDQTIVKHEFSKKIDRFNEIIKNALLNKALEILCQN
nr:RsmE family RNA methyltransferase [Mycoplasmopsis bovis]